MPLEIFATIVVLGITAVIVLIHFMGFSRKFLIDSDETARSQWLRHWPDDTVSEVHRASEGHAALIESNEGPGLLWSFGADTTARRVASAKISPCDKGLRFDLHDFTAPHVTIRLTPDEMQLWQQTLERIQQ